MKKGLSQVFCLVLIMAIFLSGESLGAQEEEKLESRYQEWLLKDVAYIITPEEKDFFLRLRTNEERNIFIEDFWRRRDPLPETPINEYREEHYRRFKYANEKLADDTPREGCLTDRGRVYILLGKPNYILREPSGIRFYPLEIWYYDNPSLRELPSGLRLLFFKRRGVGEYRLYSPFFDGLGSLMPAYYGIPNDFFLSNPRFLAQLDPDIRQAALSVAPGLGIGSSEDMLVRLYSPPRQNIRVPFEGETPRVATTIFYATIPLEMTVNYVKYNKSAYLLNYAVEIPPQHLSFSEREDKYYTRIDISGHIVDQNNQIAATIEDKVFFEQTKQELEKSKTYRFIYKDQKILIPGHYTVNLILRNYINNQMGRIGQKFAFPLLSQERLQMSSLVLGYKIQRESTAAPSQWKPFVYGDIRIFPKVDNTFDTSTNLYVYCQLYYPILKSLPFPPVLSCQYEIQNSEGKILKRIEERLTDIKLGDYGRIHLLKNLPIYDLQPGQYLVKIIAKESNLKQSCEASAPLAISGLPQNLGRFQVERMLPSTPLFTHLSLGQQYFNRGEIAQAKAHFRMALDFDPNSLPAKVKLAKCLILQRDYKTAEQILSQALSQEPNNYDALICMGSLNSSLKRYPQAIENYKKALDIGLESSTLLNALGEAYMLAGDLRSAKSCFERSLILNPDQANVKAILAQLEKKISSQKIN